MWLRGYVFFFSRLFFLYHLFFLLRLFFSAFFLSKFFFSPLWGYMVAAAELGTLIVTSLWVDLNSKFTIFIGNFCLYQLNAAADWKVSTFINLDRYFQSSCIFCSKLSHCASGIGTLRGKLRHKNHLGKPHDLQALIEVVSDVFIRQKLHYWLQQE